MRTNVSGRFSDTVFTSGRVKEKELRVRRLGFGQKSNIQDVSEILTPF
jgi:hypothetical protein